MSQRIIDIEGIGPVTFYKRSGARNIRIRISGAVVKVTLPSYVPYKAAVLYVNQKKTWIAENAQKRQHLKHGDILRTGHVLSVQYADQQRFSSKITPSTITINMPSGTDILHQNVQKKLRTIISNVLKTRAEEIVIPLTRHLADQHGYKIRSIQIKNLISRWGSCSSNKDLTFSMYLIQLPDDFIRYVIFHELCHTVHLNHSKDFWSLLANHIPNHKTIRKQLKTYAPDILVQ